MKTALGIIDAQRGFMPAEEGERLGLPGFGELGVPNGEKIIPNINRLLGAAAAAKCALFTTQDWHPESTAHFADQPNFTTTWPRHCVRNTPGAQLHPDIQWNDGIRMFQKGEEKLIRGEDDTSYSGMNAQNEMYGQKVPEYLANRNITELVLGGLALDYCVKATALDARAAGYEVTVVTDATAPVTPETGRQALIELEEAGVRLATTAELLEELKATAN